MSVEGAGERQKGAALSDSSGFFAPASLYAKEQVCGNTEGRSAPSVHQNTQLLVTTRSSAAVFVPAVHELCL